MTSFENLRYACKMIVVCMCGHDQNDLRTHIYPEIVEVLQDGNLAAPLIHTRINNHPSAIT
jgi:hypothetical protein